MPLTILVIRNVGDVGHEMLARHVADEVAVENVVGQALLESLPRAHPGLPDLPGLRLEAKMAHEAPCLTLTYPDAVKLVQQRCHTAPADREGVLLLNRFNHSGNRRVAYRFVAFLEGVVVRRSVDSENAARL